MGEREARVGQGRPCLKAIEKLLLYACAGNKNLHMSTETAAKIALENNLFIAAALASRGVLGEGRYI